MYGISFDVIFAVLNYRCTGEEFLMILDIDLSSWGFWENHVALACITIILLSVTYVRLLVFMKKRLF